MSKLSADQENTRELLQEGLRRNDIEIMQAQSEMLRLVGRQEFGSGHLNNAGEDEEDDDDDDVEIIDIDATPKRSGNRGLRYSDDVSPVRAIMDDRNTH